MMAIPRSVSVTLGYRLLAPVGGKGNPGFWQENIQIMKKTSEGNNIALNLANDLLKKYRSILSQYYCFHLAAVKVPLFVIPINVDQFQFPFKL
tara:strand:- start:105 stop:383 length:279 start_codon:yes stop_codon:yes gene_type:complete